jgi:uncharacterized protein YgbK (DUF1537 family)
LLALIRAETARLAAVRHKVVILDDVPAGVQTLYDVPVLLDWSVELLRREFAEHHPCFVVLTDSRGLPPAAAAARLHEVCRNLATAASGNDLTVVSCCDADLRGHFPLETDVIQERLGPFDATLLIPSFADRGRHTLNDVQYVTQGDQLVPVAATPSARDPSFAFRQSNVRQWVEEKCGGRIKAGDVASISVTELRQGGPGLALHKLLELARGAVCVVNAVTAADLEVLAAALLAAGQRGRRYCIRAAAEWVAIRLGLPRRLLMTSDLHLGTQPKARSSATSSPRDYEGPAAVVPKGEEHRKPSVLPVAGREPDSRYIHPSADIPGGLVLVGSCRAKTTIQLDHLPTGTRMARFELRVDRLLSSRRAVTLEQLLSGVEAVLRAGQDAIVATSRVLAHSANDAQTAHVRSRISEALCYVVERLAVRPRYLLVKGSATASEIAAEALGVKRALMLGQLLPGIPVWRLGLEAKFPDLLYVVFPGDYGNPTDLDAALRKLTG